MALNQEVKRLWIDALRSGKYARSPIDVHMIEENGNYKYSVYGVLCKLAVDHNICTYSVHDIRPGVRFYSFGMKNRISELPEEVLVWLQVSRTMSREYMQLLRLRALTGKSFKTLARLIETIL